MRLHYFWAKTTEDDLPGVSVHQHMLNVGGVARCLANASPNLLERFGISPCQAGALAALHDIGKITPGFQCKCEGWLIENSLVDIGRKHSWQSETESDHGKVSQGALQDFLVTLGLPRRNASYIAAALGAHHGRIKQQPSGRSIPLAENDGIGIDWKGERQRCAEKILADFHIKDVSGLESFDGDSVATWWLAGLTTVSDWIGSDKRFFPTEKEKELFDSGPKASEALSAISFIPAKIQGGLSFSEIFGFSPNEMQERAIEAIAEPGVYVIEAPMGMGKTEAALGAAYQLLACGKANGLYFALPTQATSNRIHLRINEFLSKIAPHEGSSRLIHGQSWLMQSEVEFVPAATGVKGQHAEDARSGHDWFASTKRSLLASFGVGTIDQALLAVVAAKHFFVRYFALAGKVVVLDEVHSYDLYTGTLIDVLVSTLERLGCTVIILSATLSGKRRSQLLLTTGGSDAHNAPYPLISGRNRSGSISPVATLPPPSRTVNVEFTSNQSGMEQALVIAYAGGTVLWICNTVESAQSQYGKICEHVKNDFPVGLLHSRFPYWRRENLEELWMERLGKGEDNRCGCILVSTQIVEQSVDLDADLLVTELAPTDMLLQRLGRLWRHPRGNRPAEAIGPKVCIIDETATLEELRVMPPKEIVNALGNKAKVYAPYILLRTLELWKKLQSVEIPSQIRWLIESTYAELEGEPASWQELSDNWFASDSAKEMHAKRNSNIWQLALDDQEGVQTRISEIDTIPVVLCRHLDDKSVTFLDGTSLTFSPDFNFPMAKAIHRNLVKVADYHVKETPCAKFVPYLHERHAVAIVHEDNSISCKGVKGNIELFYSDTLGLYIKKQHAKEGT
ncbi:CRISPR-associated helicase/endonuclease Cas3 [Chrysiogenes arsenatis]|uniref:CRISPR-associated helicase/endonuclease Cas3 n=1 Tax=Chrysiogenes arsenatis TaxID=309797 RepID=UPI0006853E03|nr:CRISPR-associated helicase/endonuclease Cas3 [Chrysiogenes arsenatis]